MENHNVAYCGLYCGACKSQLKANAPDAMETRKPPGAKSENAATNTATPPVPIASLCR